MITYVPPLEDMGFTLKALVDLDSVLKDCPGDLTSDVIESVMEGAAKFASGVLSPTDIESDREGARWTKEGVIAPTAAREGYKQFVANGWHALPCTPQYGGQGFPRTVSALIDEMWRSSNLSLTGCIALTRSAIEALTLRASEEIRRAFLPPLIEGKWTGTMNLTEPQAGSDLSAIQTVAHSQNDGSWRVKGQKIFISWGDHDMAENIVHLVLARTPNAPAGVKGISMFLVPKFLVDRNGQLGHRNDVNCVSIEKKVGQHGGVTATMIYGEHAEDPNGLGGAVGYLIGDLHRGLDTMFVMMNEARFAVGLEGLAITERAYQTARAYARDRIQGTEAGSNSQERVAIIRHPDVRRMLMRMRSSVEAMRCIAVFLAAKLDKLHHSDPANNASIKSLLDLLTPIMKGWNTETANKMTSLGVQIHGGMGFMNDCQATQHWRDARILPIYEGTTGIQAVDLVGRKIARDRGETARRLLADMEATANEMKLSDSEDLRAIGARISASADVAAECINYIVDHFESNPRGVLAGSVPFLELMGLATGGWLLGRCALVAQKVPAEAALPFHSAKITTARFFADHEMTAIPGLATEVITGGYSVLALAEDMF